MLKPRPKSLQSNSSGERARVDHMRLTKHSVGMKYLQEWSRCSGFLYAQVYFDTKASPAKGFVEEFIERFPFKIKSIQVETSSEVMAEFEKACA